MEIILVFSGIKRYPPFYLRYTSKCFLKDLQRVMRTINQSAFFITLAWSSDACLEINSGTVHWRLSERLGKHVVKNTKPVKFFSTTLSFFKFIRHFWLDITFVNTISEKIFFQDGSVSTGDRFMACGFHVHYDRESPCTLWQANTIISSWNGSKICWWMAIQFITNCFDSNGILLAISPKNVRFAGGYTHRHDFFHWA